MLQNSQRIRTLCAAAQSLYINQAKILNEAAAKHVVGYVQKRGKKDDSISTLFVPIPIKPNPDDINVGLELTGVLNKADLLKVLNKFYQKKEIKQLLSDNGLDSKSHPCNSTLVFNL